MKIGIEISVVIISLISFAYAGGISADVITTMPEQFGPGLVVEEIQKIYEISDSSLIEGYSTVLGEKDAFRIKIGGRDYYIIFWNIEDDVDVIFPGERQLNLGMDEVILADVNQDGEINVRLELNEIYYSENVSKVDVFIKKVIKKELIPSNITYFELFDVTVRLAGREIYSMEELGAFITFENFGEGNSKIDIVYSIVGEGGDEIYRGVDSKVVQTEDRVVKYFDFLDLPFGKYVLKTEIFYGQNQTGESEQEFELIEVPLLSRLSKPLIFIFIIIALFLIIKYGKRNYENSRDFKEEK